jgi:hypothetical protein
VTVDEAIDADRRYFDEHPDENEYVREFCRRENYTFAARSMNIKAINEVEARHAGLSLTKIFGATFRQTDQVLN